MGKGAQAKGGVKGAQRSGHGIGNGAQLNNQIIRAAEDKAQFLSLLHQLSNDRVKLDIVNVVTILHRGAKMRLSLPTHVVRFLGATLNEAHCKGKFKPQHVGNALYGLQRMGDSEEVRQLVAALTPKVEQCRADLRKRDVDEAISRLVHFSDSDEVRELIFVFLQEGLERAFAMHRTS